MVLSQLAGTGFQVLFHSPPGVLFTFPSRYYTLSVTKEYLALEGGPSAFPQGFSCLVVLRILLGVFLISCTRLSLSLAGLPRPFYYLPHCHIAVHTPSCTHNGLGSSAFARRYLRNRCFFLFLRLLRCFSSAGLPTSRCDRPSACRVAPFGNLRINSFLPITGAYRSLTRPSSPPEA